MAKLWLAWILVSALLVGAAARVGAATLSFAPNSQSIALGLSGSVDLVISGLGDSGPPSLGAFDLDVAFDPNLVAPSTVVFSAALGDYDLGDSDQGFSVSYGFVNLFALSFLSPDDLDTLQSSDSLTLATITFYTYAEGVSPLAFENVVLSDGVGDPLVLDSGPAGSIVVPEPALTALLAAALAALAAHRFSN